LRIAIIGTGIAGLSTAWLLAHRHEVVVYEKEERLGGHSNTVEVDVAGRRLAVDTGFIVFNEHNYPEFTRLLDHLGVATEASSMSFAVSIDEGRFEYSGASMNGLLAQKRNALRPVFWQMLGAIRRFNRIAAAYLEAGGDDASLGRFLERHRFPASFRDRYLLPMAASIWSAPTATMLAFPARSFLRFFDNHGLLSIDGHLPWRTLSHRSRDYVERLARPLASTIRRGRPVTAVRRTADGIEVTRERGAPERFDRVVLACHSDEARALLVDADPEEADLLAAIAYQPNQAVLHSDPALMPRRRAVWAAWNYVAPSAPAPGSRISVTYWMNRLQNIDERYPLFVSMNPIAEPDPALVHGRFAYAHPVFDHAALAAQTAMPRIQGRGGVHYAGAWLGYGFHEDGLRAAIETAARLGVAPPWRAVDRGRPAAAGMAIPEAAAARWA